MMKQLFLPPDLLEDLQRVDEVVLERVSSQSAVMKIAGQHLLATDGQRLRAALTLLAAQLGSYHLDDVEHAAAAVELIHTASLVHNDLVDEAIRRRGETQTQTRWDHPIALMVGDYFFALSAGEMALSPDSRVITYFSHAVRKICEGGLSPVMQAAPLEQAREQYYYKIGNTTAELFTSACKAGMAIGGGTDAQIEHLGNFGYNLGLAFQVVDDILDVTGDEAVSGKPVGDLLRRGVITLPLIYAVSAGGGDELASVVDSDDEEQLTWAVGMVQRLGVAPARAEAETLVQHAREHLSSFPDSPARRVLYDISAFVVQREQ